MNVPQWSPERHGLALPKVTASASRRAPIPKVDRGGEFLGTWGVHAQTLSRRLPYAVRMHDAVTSSVVGSVTRRVRHGPEPPPLRRLHNWRRPIFTVGCSRERTPSLRGPTGWSSSLRDDGCAAEAVAPSRGDEIADGPSRRRRVRGSSPAAARRASSSGVPRRRRDATLRTTTAQARKRVMRQAHQPAPSPGHVDGGRVLEGGEDRSTAVRRA